MLQSVGITMLGDSCYLFALDRGQSGNARGERVSQKKWQHMRDTDLCLQFQ